jgi:hypothetical protein
LLPNGLVQRQNNQLLAQTRDENRRPIFVVANLHSHDSPGEELVHFGRESTRVAFNVPKASRDPAGWIENGGVIAFARDSRLPCEEQRIVMFHRLQKPKVANTFRAPFRR